MEKLQRVDVVLDVHHRAVEGERVEHQVLQTVKVYVVAKEAGGHIEGDVAEIHAGQVL